jgi:hypothetical protein
MKPTLNNTRVTSAKLITNYSNSNMNTITLLKKTEAYNKKSTINTKKIKIYQAKIYNYSN